jgi:predicted DNA-binding protein
MCYTFVKGVIMKAKRIHVTFDDCTREILDIISSKENRPLSEVVRRMVEEWMERHEDVYWAEIAYPNKKDPTLSHEEVWDV